MGAEKKGICEGVGSRLTKELVSRFSGGFKARIQTVSEVPFQKSAANDAGGVTANVPEDTITIAFDWTTQFL